MYGYAYMTINSINNKFYIGQHKCQHYDRSYLGSGKILRFAIDKYGKENFSQIVLEECESKEILDISEKKWIKYYKDMSPSLCYNLALGGDGGDVFYYQSDASKQDFIIKMTAINKERCSKSDFKEKISKASSYLNIKCCFELNGKKIYFNSIKELKSFLKTEYGYKQGNNKITQLMEQGKNGIEFSPYHKNKFHNLIGMKIYKIDDDVETNCDECSSVEVEISATPKDEALD